MDIIGKVRRLRLQLRLRKKLTIIEIAKVMGVRANGQKVAECGCGDKCVYRRSISRLLCPVIAATRIG